MNFKRFIAVLLVLVCACACFASCGGDENEGKVKEELTKAPEVSFNLSVRNVTAKKNVIPKVDYTYCGSDFKITTILDWYCEVDFNATEKLTFKLNDKDGSIAQIGDVKAGEQDSGGYGYFYMVLNGEVYGETKDTKGLSYYDYVVKDGDEIQICFEIIYSE